MSSDDSQNDPVVAGRRDAVREKAQQVQAKQSRARQVRIGVLATVVVAVVAAAALTVTWTVSSSAAKPKLTPANVNDDGFTVAAVTGVGIATDDTRVSDEAADNAAATLGAAETAEPTATPTPTTQPTVDIRVYVDYLSTGSRDFQLANVQQLTKWVDTDAASLTYYPVAMLTAKSNGTKYSQRAAGAAACVATHSPDAFFAYNNALLKEQPAIDTEGLTDAELADLAQASGAKGAKVVRACIEDREYAAWAKAATDRALEELPGTDGIALTGTPMVLVNGTPYVGALDDPKEFAQFVLTTASDAYYKATPTPTPTPAS